VGQAATRLDSPTSAIHVHHGFVLMKFRLVITFLIKGAFPRNTRCQTKWIRRRSNARVHSPFETPRIQKSDGPRADPSSPSEPISIRKVPQHDLASYTLPGKPNRQLTKDDLSTYDFQLLNAIEAVANSLPYRGNEVFRNELILDNEIRTSTALTCFFLDGEVTELQPGFNFLRD
jgi:hypothetical protein